MKFTQFSTPTTTPTPCPLQQGIYTSSGSYLEESLGTRSITKAETRISLSLFLFSNCVAEVQRKNGGSEGVDLYTTESNRPRRWSQVSAKLPQFLHSQGLSLITSPKYVPIPEFMDLFLICFRIACCLLFVQFAFLGSSFTYLANFSLLYGRKFWWLNMINFRGICLTTMLCNGLED